MSWAEPNGENGGTTSAAQSSADRHAWPMQVEVALQHDRARDEVAARMTEAVLAIASAASPALREGQSLDFSADPFLSAHVRHIRLFDVAAAATKPAVLHLSLIHI